MKRVLIPILLSVFALACAPATPPASVPPSVSGDSFSKFVDHYFDARFAYAPSRATATGFHQYDAKLENRSRPRTPAARR